MTGPTEGTLGGGAEKPEEKLETAREAPEAPRRLDGPQEEARHRALLRREAAAARLSSGRPAAGDAARAQQQQQQQQPIPQIPQRQHRFFVRGLGPDLGPGGARSGVQQSREQAPHEPHWQRRLRDATRPHPGGEGALCQGRQGLQGSPGSCSRGRQLPLVLLGPVSRLLAAGSGSSGEDPRHRPGRWRQRAWPKLESLGGSPPRGRVGLPGGRGRLTFGLALAAGAASQSQGREEAQEGSALRATPRAAGPVGRAQALGGAGLGPQADPGA